MTTLTPVDGDPFGGEDPMLSTIRGAERSGDNATSPKGAKGRFQITRATADAYHIDYDRLSNPDYAERSADRIIKHLRQKFGDDEPAIMVAYNAGPGVADKWISSGRKASALPDETKAYLSGHGYNPGAVKLVPVSGDPFGGQHPDAKPTPPKPAAPAGQHPFADYFRREGQALGSAVTARTAPAGAQLGRDIDQDIAQSQDPRAMHRGPGGFMRLGGEAMDALNAVAAPAMGVSDYLLGRPGSAATGGRIKPQAVTDVASMVAPIGEGMAAERALQAGAKAAGLSVEAFKASQAGRRVAEAARMAPPKPSSLKPSAPRGDKVRALEQAGVQLTPGMRAGGRMREAEEARRSSPYVGRAVQEAERKTEQTFNRALYNQALKPLGITYDGPVGREGVGNLKKVFSDAYTKLLPSVKAKMDDGYSEELQRLSARADKFGPEVRTRFDAIVNQDVHQFFAAKGGTIDGETFKRIEGELSQQSRGLKGDPSYKERELGRLVDDLNDALRNSAERHSNPGARVMLKRLNTGYAMLTRIEDAAARRINAEDGLVSTGDLVASVKKGDRTARKGAFARGDALLQGFAESAHEVIRPRLNDSGTARRLKEGVFGRAVSGAVGAGLGAHIPVIGPEIGAGVGAAVGGALDAPIAAATNALARHGLEKAARRGMSAAGPHAPVNHLKAILARTNPALSVGRGAGLGLGVAGALHAGGFPVSGNGGRAVEGAAP